MNISQNVLKQNIDNIKHLVGSNNMLILRDISIGKKTPVDAAIVYIEGLANKDMIDRDILKPLMLQVEEDLIDMTNIEKHLCKKYITMSNVFIETDLNKVSESIKRGKTAVLIENSQNFIIVDTHIGVHRAISDPINETSVRGPRDGFIEDLETNLSLIKRRIKDKNLVTEKFILGRRSQTDAVLMYIDGVVDMNLLEKVRTKIMSIDIDNIQATSYVDQFIEKHPFSIFPQTIATERPDKIQSKLMEGRIALFLENTPFVMTFPTLFAEFFQTVEDYYQRTIVASFIRILRYIAVITVIILPAIYVTLVNFNAELIPLDLVKTLIESSSGVVLTPFLSILSMNLVVEFLREGGLRLPSKIGQTLSVVGGIILGQAAIESKFVSSTTLLIVGITTIATFLIPNYEMSHSIRLLNYPTLILANWLGMLGVAMSLIFILTYLCSLDSFGVPYFSFKSSDLKDTIFRAPLWMMNKNPKSIPNNNALRQTDFRWKFWRKKNG
jgi:spore germination protein KA